MRKQVESSIFALSIFGALALSHWQPLPRYDFLLLACFGVQVYMVRSGMETRRELAMICLFHILGLGLESYKVMRGSWSYPEPALTKLLGVPLYAGFMYASVASYILQAWRRFGLEFRRLPAPCHAWLLCLAIYANFMASHVWRDARWVIVALLLAAFGRSSVAFSCDRQRFAMPALVAFGLIGACIWLAENICTRLGAWVYPNQIEGWAPVHPMKIVSWSLMGIIAFVIVWRWQARLESTLGEVAETAA